MQTLFPLPQLNKLNDLTASAFFFIVFHEFSRRAFQSRVLAITSSCIVLLYIVPTL